MPTATTRLTLVGVLGALLALLAAGAARAASLAETYAPLVYLHPDEEFWPLSADRALARSQLRWAHSPDCGEPDLVAARVEPASLGAGAYRHDLTSPLCPGITALFSSAQLTRPFTGITGEAGFFLDLDDSLRFGDPSGRSWLAYYGLSPRRYLVYWFLYGASGPPGSAQLVHEGDWENVTIRLDSRNRPTHVAFFAHGEALVCRWRDVARAAGHPVVYSALGSHALYPRAGVWESGDVTARGRAWRSWQRLANVRRQGWFGFGGAWGQVGASAVTTGPLGPSRHKSPLPASWQTAPGCPAP